MGKNKDGGAKRTKGNAKPSSSSRSAELLLSRSGGSVSGLHRLGGVGSQQQHGVPPAVAPVFGLVGSASLFPDGEDRISGDVKQAMKKMNKKDATTKLKALQEFTELLKNEERAKRTVSSNRGEGIADTEEPNEAEEIKAVLPFWPRLYNKLATDPDKRVREAAQQAHFEIVSRAGRELAPHLKALAPVWFLSRSDPHPPAASLASRAFAIVFPSSPGKNKLREAVLHCQTEIMTAIRDNLVVHTRESLSDPQAVSPEDMEAKHTRTLCNSLLGYSSFLDMVLADAGPDVACIGNSSANVKEALLKNKDIHESIVNDGKFWKLSQHKNPTVRSSWYKLICTFCKCCLPAKASKMDVPEALAMDEKGQTDDLLTDKHVGKLASAVFGHLDDTSDPTVTASIWDAALYMASKCKDLGLHLDIEGKVAPKVLAMIQKDSSSAAQVAPKLLPLVSKMQEMMMDSDKPGTKDGGRVGFFAALLEALEKSVTLAIASSGNNRHGNVAQPAGLIGTRALIEAYFECALFFLVSNSGSSTVCSFVSDLVNGWMKRVLIVPFEDGQNLPDRHQLGGTGPERALLTAYANFLNVVDLQESKGKLDAAGNVRKELWDWLVTTCTFLHERALPSGSKAGEASCPRALELLRTLLTAFYGTSIDSGLSSKKRSTRFAAQDQDRTDHRSEQEQAEKPASIRATNKDLQVIVANLACGFVRDLVNFERATLDPQQIRFATDLIMEINADEQEKSVFHTNALEEIMKTSKETNEDCTKNASYRVVKAAMNPKILRLYRHNEARDAFADLCLALSGIASAKVVPKETAASDLQELLLLLLPLANDDRIDFAVWLSAVLSRFLMLGQCKGSSLDLEDGLKKANPDSVSIVGQCLILPGSDALLQATLQLFQLNRNGPLMLTLGSLSNQGLKFHHLWTPIGVIFHCAGELLPSHLMGDLLVALKEQLEAAMEDVVPSSKTRLASLDTTGLCRLLSVLGRSRESHNSLWPASKAGLGLAVALFKISSLACTDDPDKAILDQAWTWVVSVLAEAKAGSDEGQGHSSPLSIQSFVNAVRDLVKAECLCAPDNSSKIPARNLATQVALLLEAVASRDEASIEVGKDHARKILNDILDDLLGESESPVIDPESQILSLAFHRPPCFLKSIHGDFFLEPLPGKHDPAVEAGHQLTTNWASLKTVQFFFAILEDSALLQLWDRSETSPCLMVDLVERAGHFVKVVASLCHLKTLFGARRQCSHFSPTFDYVAQIELIEVWLFKCADLAGGLPSNVLEEAFAKSANFGLEYTQAFELLMRWTSKCEIEGRQQTVKAVSGLMLQSVVAAQGQPTQSKITAAKLQTILTLLDFVERDDLGSFIMLEVGRILSLDPCHGTLENEDGTTSSRNRALLTPSLHSLAAALSVVSSRREKEYLLKDEQAGLKAVVQLILNWRQNFGEDFLFSTDLNAASGDEIAFVCSLCNVLNVAVQLLGCKRGQMRRQDAEKEDKESPVIDLEAAHWDLILCSLSSWIQSVEETSLQVLKNFGGGEEGPLDECLQKYFKLTGFYWSVVDLLVSVTEAVSNLKTVGGPQHQLVQEWEEFFAEAICGPILPKLLAMSSSLEGGLFSLSQSEEGKDAFEITKSAKSKLALWAVFIRILEALGCAVEVLPDQQLKDHRLEAKFVTDDVDVVTVLPDKILFLLNHFAPLLLSKYRAIRTSSYKILARVMAMVADFEEIKDKNEPEVMIVRPAGLGNGEEYKEVPRRLMEVVMQTEQALDRLYKGELELDFGEPLPGPLPVNSGAYLATFSYLLSWKLMVDLVSKASPDVRPKYSEYLRRGNMLDSLLTLLFHIMVTPDSCTSLETTEFGQADMNQSHGGVEGGTGLSSPSKKAPFGGEPDLKCQAPLRLDDSWENSELKQLACSVYHGLLKTLPALIRNWWNLADKRVASIVEKFTTLRVTPTIWAEEVGRITLNKTMFTNMTVKVRPSVREVVATYSLESDEGSMELVIQLPANFPLGPVQVESARRVGVTTSQWRTWMLQLTTFLQNQNGSIIDALSVWKRNVDKRFEGVEECYICFYVLHGSNYQLPKLACRTCKKKFHAACLYKWFSTSNNSTCPLCRNLF